MSDPLNDMPPLVGKVYVYACRDCQASVEVEVEAVRCSKCSASEVDRLRAEVERLNEALRDTISKDPGEVAQAYRDGWVVGRLNDSSLKSTEWESALNAERLALHRLRTEMQAADINHIRLRDGLRCALGAWQAHLTGLEKRLVGGPDGGTRAERAEIAELRKLLGPEGA